MTGLCCLLCEALARHEHHATGRRAPGVAYLDPLLVVNLCQRHHIAEHQALRRLGLDWPGPGSDLIAHRLMRLATFANRAADANRGLVLSVGSTRGLATLLLDGAKAVNASREVRAS